jgi:hypothetical protein
MLSLNSLSQSVATSSMLVIQLIRVRASAPLSPNCSLNCTVADNWQGPNEQAI